MSSEAAPRGIYVDSIDGVPLLWIDAPPPYYLFLMFRVGRADEQLTNSGISHLVEHLAFPHDHSPDSSSNGTTSLTNTTFYAWGDPDEAAAFIRQASITLANLPVDRIDQQRAIILTEEASAGGGPGAELLTERYGARGHGVVGFRQLGMHRVGRPEVVDWSRRYFTADNAILCAIGRPGARLALELPRGQRMPAPAAVSVDGPLPRWAPQAFGQIGLGVVTPHDPASGMAHRILERRLFRRLRHDLALSYSVQSASQIVDPRTLHRAIVADSQPDSSPEVARHVVEMAEELAARGPRGDELEEDIAVLERQLRDDPRALGGWMMHAAECYLNGIEVQELHDYIDSRRDLSVGQVRDAWARAYSTAIYVVPQWVEIHPAKMPQRQWSPAPAPSRGMTFHPPGIGRLRPGVRATLGEDAISISTPDTSPRTMRFDRAAALVRTGPLGRSLIGVDGTALSIDATQFSNSRELVARLDNRIPNDKWIDLPGPA